MPSWCSADPLLRPSSLDLAVAPELGVLAALDATLATATYQVIAEHPELELNALARGDLPSPEARAAGRLASRFADLRAAIREYRDLAIDAASFDDQLDLPF